MDMARSRKKNKARSEATDLKSVVVHNGSTNSYNYDAANTSTGKRISSQFVSTVMVDFAQKTKQTIQSLAQPRTISPLETWDDDSLRYLLAQKNIVVRGTSYTPHEVLVRLCEELYLNTHWAVTNESNHFLSSDQQQPNQEQQIQNTHKYYDHTPDSTGFPLQFTVQDITKMEIAVRRIQQFFFQRQMVKNCQAQQRKENRHKKRTQAHQIKPSNITFRSPKAAKINQKNTDQKQKEVEIQQSHSGSDYYEPDDDDDDDMDEIEVLWRKPSWKRAKMVEAESRPHHAGEHMKIYDWRTATTGRHCVFGGCGEQLDLWDEGQLSEFTQFGSGITNYFKFLKWCCWIMVILSMIHLPMVIINSFGESAKLGTASVAITTVGNLGAAQNVSTVVIPGCNRIDYQQDLCNISKQHLAVFYSLLDAAGTIIVILGWLWLRKFEQKEAKNLNRKTVTASDFTICVQNLPSNNTTESQLATHFEKVTQEKVADVNLALDNEAEISLFLRRGVLTKKRYDCVQKIRYLKTMKILYSEEALDEQLLSKLLKERKRLGDMIQKKDEERIAYLNPNPRVLQAFVTFETETGFIKAVAAYQLRWFRSLFCFYPKHLLFLGRRLRVMQAPDPSTILWENLGYTKASKGCRKLFTTMAAVLAIFLSVVATFWATDFQQKMLKSYDIPCPENFSSLPIITQQMMTQHDTSLAHCFCSTLSMTKQRSVSNLCGGYLKQRMRSKVAIYSASVVVILINMLFTILMDKAGAFEKHNSLDAMETSIMVRIFFAKFVNTAILLLLFNMKWLQIIVRASIEFEPNFGVRWYQMAGSSLVIVMVMNILSPHIIPLLAYQKYRYGIRRVEKNLTDDGETNDKSQVWYSQEELNSLVVGPPFTLNYRYAQTLVTFFACWMYSLSMPVMPIIGSVTFLVQYWVDKFLFCNYYKTPPRYSDSMGKASTDLVALSVIIHLCMSLWMSGRGLIFVPDPIVGSRIFGDFNGVKELSNLERLIAKFLPGYLLQKHLIVLELVLIIFLVGIVLSQIASCGVTQVLKVLRCVFCSTGNKVSNLQSMMNTVQVTYRSAKERRILKGLATYNILQNPKYQEAFAITDEFAEEHNLLSDIQGVNTKEGSLCSQSKI